MAQAKILDVINTQTYHLAASNKRLECMLGETKTFQLHVANLCETKYIVKPV